MADIRIIRCTRPPEAIHTCIAHRTSHADAGLLEAIAADSSPIASWKPIDMDLPALNVDASDGYHPVLLDIIAFATGKA